MFKISITILFLAVFTTAHAQIPTSIDGIIVQTNPAIPVPNQKVEVSIESYNMDLSGASIVWIVDGKIQSQGIGIKKIEVTAKKSGSPTNINISIKTTDGREINKSLSIKSSYVDLIWESDGYTPPFFKGKSDFVYQNKVRIIAIPHISKDGASEMDPKTLVYKWKNDGKNITQTADYGKQSIEIDGGDLPRPLNVTVEVYSRDGQDVAIGNIVLTPGNPSLTFYEEDSLYGTLFNKAITERAYMKNSEIKIRAIPYGFNINTKDDTNIYTWFINNTEQTDLSKNKSIIVRTRGDTEGISNINLNISNPSKILQGVQGAFDVYFNKKEEVLDQGNVIF